MGRKFKVIVGGLSKRDFGWTIPDAPYTLAISNEGAQVSYALSDYIFCDPDTTPVWGLVSAPDGVTLDSSGILIKPASLAISSGYTISVSLSRDTAGFEETGRTFLLPVNGVPVWAGSAPLQVTIPIGGSYDFGQYVSDPDGGALTFELVPPVPSGYDIDPATGVVRRLS